jgi:hypothetical protein
VTKARRGRRVRATLHRGSPEQSGGLAALVGASPEKRRREKSADDSLSRHSPASHESTRTVRFLNARSSSPSSISLQSKSSKSPERVTTQRRGCRARNQLSPGTGEDEDAALGEEEGTGKQSSLGMEARRNEMTAFGCTVTNRLPAVFTCGPRPRSNRYPRSNSTIAFGWSVLYRRPPQGMTAVRCSRCTRHARGIRMAC